MGFWTTLGKIGDKVGDISGDIAGGLGAAGAAIAATGIGLPLAGLVEAGAGAFGTVALGGKSVGIVGGALGDKG